MKYADDCKSAASVNEGTNMWWIDLAKVVIPMIVVYVWLLW